MKYIIQHGIGQAVEKLLKQIKTKNVYISLDLDSIDKEYAPGMDMSTDGALTYRELIYTLLRSQILSWVSNHHFRGNIV